MNMRLRALGGLAAVFAVLWLTGCEVKVPPKVTPVTCTVTYKGELVEGASVVFIPVIDTQGRTAPGMTAASGVTDASGKAALRAFAERLGALPGDYYVIITKTETDETAEPSEGAANESDGDSDENGVPAPAHLISLIPIKYADYRASGLKATVGDEPLVVSYDLTD